MRKIVSTLLLVFLLASNFQVFAASNTDKFSSKIVKSTLGDNISILKQIVNVTHLKSDVDIEDETFVGDEDFKKLFKNSSKYTKFYNSNTISSKNTLKNQTKSGIKFYQLSNNNDLNNEEFYEVELKYALKNTSSKAVNGSLSFSSYSPNDLYLSNMASGVSDLSFLKTLFVLPSSNYGIYDFSASINGIQTEVTSKNTLSQYKTKEFFTDYSKASNLSRVIFYDKTYNFDMSFDANSTKVLTIKYLVPASIYKGNNEFLYDFDDVFSGGGKSISALKINLKNEIKGYSFLENLTTFGEDYSYNDGIYSLIRKNMTFGSIKTLGVNYGK